MKQPTVFDEVTFRWEKNGTLYIRISYNKTVDEAFLLECDDYKEPSIWSRLFKGDTKIRYYAEMHDLEEAVFNDCDMWLPYNTNALRN